MGIDDESPQTPDTESDTAPVGTLRPTLDYLSGPEASPPPPADAIFAVRDVSVRFKRFVAVDRVSFSLRGGDLLGLIGPNGAGKTTLLRTVAGLQPADAGRIDILGQRLDRSDGESMRHIGFTPDVPPSYEQLTIRQYLQFIGRGYGLGRAEIDERIDFWLAKVWLSEKADQKVTALSRGMKQRVGLARTLLPNPHVILLDEPAAGLDPRGRVQFRELLNELRRQGKAVIVSSHILADMDEYCSHIGVMSHGRLVRFGTVREISRAVSGDADTGHATYRAKIAKPVIGLLETLGAIDGVTEATLQGDLAFTVNYDAGNEAAARLLGELLRRGLLVCAFAEVQGDLEQAYLQTGISQVD